MLEGSSEASSDKKPIEPMAMAREFRNDLTIWVSACHFLNMIVQRMEPNLLHLAAKFFREVDS